MSYYMPKKNSTLYRMIGLLSLNSISLFMLLSLITFNPRDISLFYSSTSHSIIKNMCGIAGAYCASFLVYLTGGASIILPLLLLYCSWMWFFQKKFKNEWERIAAIVLLVPTIASLFNIFHADVMRGSVPGGLIGFAIVRCVRSLFDTIGTLIILNTLLLICTILIMQLSFIVIGQYITAATRYIFSQKGLPTWIAATSLYIKIIYYKCASAYEYLKNLLSGKEIEQESIYEFEAGLSYETSSDNAWNGLQPSTVDPSVPTVMEDQSAQETVESSETESSTAIAQGKKEYHLPDPTLFEAKEMKAEDKKIEQELKQSARVLEEKLERFGVVGKVVAIKPGPVVTLFEYEPHIDTKISKITSLEDDLAMALQALSIRIIAPIPGTSFVGFEVSNQHRKAVYYSSIVQSPEFKHFSGALPLIFGQDTVGNNVIIDLIKMPHLLIAGSTGSGKSVALNAMLVSLLCSKSPEELKLILIDPKRLEFASYSDIAHLIFPIITDPRKAVAVLRWVVSTMEHRYEQMAAKGVRNIIDYKNMYSHEDPMPYIVVIIDELADLMMTAGKDIEELITRLSQMARAAGIHLMVATQRPSVDVITGLIKVNFPSRISFRVTSKIDSRTILDCAGADKLLGRGDMLFLDASSSLLKRVHGAFVTDKEIMSLVNHIRSECTVEYLNLEEETRTEEEDHLFEEDDEIYKNIVSFVNEIDEVSISMLQRRFRIGYNRSARIIDALESAGKIMPADGGKMRKVIRQ